jgi:hypothetical protein
MPDQRWFINSIADAGMSSKQAPVDSMLGRQMPERQEGEGCPSNAPVEIS